MVIPIGRDGAFGYLRAMLLSLPRCVAASLLLAVMLFTALPRTWFHHCEEGRWSKADRDAMSVVHADSHCPICEAPAPVTPDVTPCLLHIDMVPLGSCVQVAVHEASVPWVGAVWLRGPPRMG